MPNADPAIHQAAEELRDAEGDEAKANAEKKLRNVLTEYFNKDMEQRQKSLEQMQARLEKLKGQLERRRAKEDEIVDLQIKVLINEVEGLGFFSGGAGGGGGMTLFPAQMGIDVPDEQDFMRGRFDPYSPFSLVPPAKKGEAPRPERFEAPTATAPPAAPIAPVGEAPTVHASPAPASAASPAAEPQPALKETPPEE
jgi:hypothetical protein